MSATPARDELDQVAVATLRPSRSKDLPWTWEDEELNIRSRQCLCCGRPGHYQETIEAHIAVYGFDGLAIHVDGEGYVEDGHHRVVAAIRLGFVHVPVESNEACRARWVRDHGHVDWFHRKFGDR